MEKLIYNIYTVNKAVGGNDRLYRGMLKHRYDFTLVSAFCTFSKFCHLPESA